MKISTRSRAEGLSSLPDTSTHLESTAVFRFLDLPPELRDHIYSFVTSDLGSHSLAFFKPPPITRVSKAVRCESLAVLFAEGDTHIIVGTDFFQRNPLPQGFAPTWGTTKSGSLYIHPIVERCITGAKSSALFRNVTFDAHHPVVLRDGPGRALWDNSFQVATLNLQVKNGLLTVSERSANPYYKFKRLSTEADVQAALDVVVQIAEEIAARDQFSGFTLEDLKAVARKFRFF